MSKFHKIYDFQSPTCYSSFMKEFLSHFSAAYRWNIDCLDSVVGVEYANMYKKNLVTDITVTHHSMKRKRNHECIIHVCEQTLPTSSVTKQGNTFIASPELVFLQMSNELDIHRLILLGLQMCSHPVGRKEKAVTTTDNLNSFLKKTSGHHGHKRAEQALRYVTDGSASIMESIAFMILTLPHLYGGFGLSGACFNYKIPLDPRGRRQLGKSSCFVDIYYEKEKLAVEYDSFAYHNTPTAQGNDNVRASTLERLGIEVVRFSTIQLYDKKVCKDFAGNLASRLGKRVRIRSKRYEEEQSKLWKLLPSKS